MTVADEPLEPPREAVPAGVSIVAHWSFFFDNLPDDIGGWVTGEFLLRSDGDLLWRTVIERRSGDIKRWEAGAWQDFHRFGPDSDKAAVEAWLGSRKYQLADNPAIPADARVGPEIHVPVMTGSAPGPHSAPGPPRRLPAWLSRVLAIPLLVVFVAPWLVLLAVPLLGLLLIVQGVRALLGPGDPSEAALVALFMGIPLAWLGAKFLRERLK